MSCLASNIGNHLNVRLVNGPNNASGRVEVQYNASFTWGTVCDDGWDLNDATVVCRMLGFFKASSAPVMAEYGPGFGHIFLDEVECTGSENSLEDCIKSKFGVHDCTHSEDAGVICEDSEPDDFDTSSSSAIDIDLPAIQPDIMIPSTRNIGNHLNVRLVNGPNNASGRVEVQYNASFTWGTVCDDGWDLNDANVVCRMLGFFRASSAPVMAAYGAGYGEIHLDEVECTGSENSLEDCIRSEYGDHDCTHFEDAAVICEVSD
ncbi:deleted in malignant brain tumors 1 protein-like [Strongylocentrotus purpuratus]|uniref:SRCR domain-containing protein n=1 Tax=Strongylocentrotus purpuratus TaxID=7668 RepID=A0A7M7P686_STRPU|nr:deleted in malignant brain tumors 1 protein-like [Strongylocentrotus purpuratus]